jgi:hypothetical protein
MNKRVITGYVAGAPGSTPERIDELVRASGAPEWVSRETAEDPPKADPQAPPAASTGGVQVIPRKQPGHAGSMTGPFRVMGSRDLGFGTPMAHASRMRTGSARWLAAVQGHANRCPAGTG